jgi:hypothetical protein
LLHSGLEHLLVVADALHILQIQVT